eukprot:CAMPEP_0115885822 /NCGR_PEP_ID=MMETSP0287-20121206/30879_1 /TAXON_ID=412157 /ORGANISM="Chrysochromulina rotalis, Strain UIO044" /LENGTH=141 /DNA_ID=CAMNT_0003342265 /DNA_START=115 /DNA_END=540 /DNA_ORIENTATION=+
MTDTTPSEQPSVDSKESSRPVTRTPAQLEALQKARVKAAEVRAKNTELRRKERELVNAQLQESRRLREESIQREHAERFQTKEETRAEEQKKPKRKRRVVVVQDSSSEEEIEVKLPKQKKSAAQNTEDELYRLTYQRMFEI